MSKEAKKEALGDAMHDKLLSEIENTISNTEPSQLNENLKELNLDGIIRNSVTGILAGLKGVSSLLPSTDGLSAGQHALTRISNPSATRARIRLAYALGADSDLANEMGLSADAIGVMPEDRVVSLYNQLKQQGRVL
ncbi:MAG: hypothetical protein WD081_01910 [Gammaproteobacteria bacterium]